MAEPPPPQDLKVQLPRPTCAYCKAPVEIRDEKSACEACMSWAHAECASAHGACPACGAGQAPRPPRRTLKEAPLAGASPVSETEVAQGVEGAGERPPVQAPPATTIVDLLLLLLVGFAFFAVSALVLGVLVSSIGKAFDLFNEPGAGGRVAAWAAMGSILTTPLFLTWVAQKLTQRRAALRAAEEPSSSLGTE